MVKLADFGIAKALKSNEIGAQEKSFVGTMRYMVSAREGHDIKRRALYCRGVCCSRLNREQCICTVCGV